jgi:hypothetical protein
VAAFQPAQTKCLIPVQTHFVKIRECWSTFSAHLAIPHDSNKSVTRKTDQPFLLNMLQQSTQIRTTSTTAIRAKRFRANATCKRNKEGNHSGDNWTQS